MWFYKERTGIGATPDNASLVGKMRSKLRGTHMRKIGNVDDEQISNRRLPPAAGEQSSIAGGALGRTQICEKNRHVRARGRRCARRRRAQYNGRSGRCPQADCVLLNPLLRHVWASQIRERSGFYSRRRQSARRASILYSDSILVGREIHPLFLAGRSARCGPASAQHGVSPTLLHLAEDGIARGESRRARLPCSAGNSRRED